jgi:hypothetical protein
MVRAAPVSLHRKLLIRAIPAPCAASHAHGDAPHNQLRRCTTVAVARTIAPACSD